MSTMDIWRVELHELKVLAQTWTYDDMYRWMFPKIGVPQNGWFVMEHPIKMDDLGVPLLLETPIYGCVL